MQSTREYAEENNLNGESVRRACKAGRIAGARQFGTQWRIPEGAVMLPVGETADKPKEEQAVLELRGDAEVVRKLRHKGQVAVDAGKADSVEDWLFGKLLTRVKVK